MDGVERGSDREGLSPKARLLPYSTFDWLEKGGMLKKKRWFLPVQRTSGRGGLLPQGRRLRVGKKLDDLGTSASEQIL